ncbi:MAG TPA: DUF6804 family protein [Phycisphaerae bacterium]|nr:DUF6804 family protein [Phycisphaerae bacterium]
MDRQIKTSIFAVAAVCVAMLLIAMGRQPYSYYQFLRWIVCASSLWFLLYAIRLKALGIALVLGLLAVTYNPLAPIRFGRGTWAVVNVVSALAIAVSAMSVVRLSRGSEKRRDRVAHPNDPNARKRDDEVA